MTRAVLIAILPSLLACHGARDDAWRQGLVAWKKQRVESIAGEDGWVTLVARAWLRPGENRFGSDEQADLKLPADRAPKLAGSIFLEGDQLRVQIADGVDVRVEGQPIHAQAIADDRDSKPTVMTLGSLTMRVIKRQDRYALRVKDKQHPARKTFGGLAYYPNNPSLRVHAQLEAAPLGKTIPIVNVLGQIQPMPSPGTLRFVIKGVAHTLDAVHDDGEDGLFILFADQTSGHGTYPSGRFIYTPVPKPDGSVELDFNRAFNPPCAFTAFATCPIPPKQNHLPLRIEAGELYTGVHE